MNLTKNTGLNDLVPSEFYLGQNYPNPFSERTIIKYCVAYKTKVKLEVFDSEDKMIKTLIDEEKDAGTYEVTWDACEFTAKGEFASGIYYYQLTAGDYTERKMMLMIK